MNSNEETLPLRTVYDRMIEGAPVAIADKKEMARFQRLIDALHARTDAQNQPFTMEKQKHGEDFFTLNIHPAQREYAHDVIARELADDEMPSAPIGIPFTFELTRFQLDRHLEDMAFISGNLATAEDFASKCYRILSYEAFIPADFTIESLLAFDRCAWIELSMYCATKKIKARLVPRNSDPSELYLETSPEDYLTVRERIDKYLCGMKKIHTQPVAFNNIGNIDGIKHDANKSRVDLLPPRALRIVADVLTFGAKKYSEENGPKRYLRAALSHTLDHMAGERLDPESGLPHLAHAACLLLFILELEQ